MQSITSDLGPSALNITSNELEYPILEPDTARLETEVSTSTCAQSLSLHVEDEHSPGQISPATTKHSVEPAVHQLGVSDVELMSQKPHSSPRKLLVVTVTTVFAVPLALFTFYYLQQALVSENPSLGRLFLAPSPTLTLVSVLTQTLAVGLPLLLNYLFDLIHLPLRPAETSRFSLSAYAPNAAASFQGRLKAIFLLGTCFLSDGQRFLLPLLGLALGIVTMVSMRSTQFFTVHETLGVFAGLTPLNASLLDHGLVPISVLGTYFAAWVSSMTGVSKFVFNIKPARCTENCTSIFLPGGLEGVRRLQRNLSGTLLDSGVFVDGDSIIVYDAPGYHLEFSPLRESFSFNQSVDCFLEGQSSGQGIYICVASDKEYLVAGWSICPTDLLNSRSCFDDTFWTYPTQQNTSLLAFKRIADTAYNRADLSIISVEKITPVTNSSIVRYEPGDFLYIFRQLLSINSTASADDITMVDAARFELGWALRLYAEVFKDDHDSPEKILQNLLTIPIHFSATAWELANSTIAQQSGGNIDSYALPVDLITTASSAHLRPRQKAARWTVDIFIGLGSGVLLYSIALLVYILNTRTRSQEPPSGEDEDGEANDAEPKENDSKVNQDHDGDCSSCICQDDA